MMVSFVCNINLYPHRKSNEFALSVHIKNIMACLHVDACILPYKMVIHMNGKCPFLILMSVFLHQKSTNKKKVQTPVSELYLHNTLFQLGYLGNSISMTK